MRSYKRSGVEVCVQGAEEVEGSVTVMGKVVEEEDGGGVVEEADGDEVDG